MTTESSWSSSSSNRRISSSSSSRISSVRLRMRNEKQEEMMDNDDESQRTLVSPSSSSSTTINGDDDDDDDTTFSSSSSSFTSDSSRNKENYDEDSDDGSSTNRNPTSSFDSSIGVVDEEPIPSSLLSLPRHSHDGVNEILVTTEATLKALHSHAQREQKRAATVMKQQQSQQGSTTTTRKTNNDTNRPSISHNHEDIVFANSYVDLGKVDTVGFDYDYTLVTYTEELLELIYDMALKRLVHDKQYPLEMLKTQESQLKFNPQFSIRGLAVDKETAWICHLSYTHKVAVAWEGHDKVSTASLYREYRGKRALTPKERRQRLKPLNDLFSMAECCLIADTVQFFKQSGIPYCPRNTVTDVLAAIRETHISGDFHRIVAEQPDRYFRPNPHLKTVLDNFKQAGKRLIFVSNSPFWYVDAGMKYVIGDDWRESWDAVITSAGKPAFYTEDRRPFREVNKETGRIKFKRVERFEKGEVYTEGCLKELTKLFYMDEGAGRQDEYSVNYEGGATALASPNVLYIGDSLFADLVDAKREFGWTTAAVTPEVGYEMEMQSRPHFVQVRRTIDLLLNALRLLQDELGASQYTDTDRFVLDTLESLVSRWRDRETALLGNPFGSVFRARYAPSLFSHSLRRYCDLYMTSVSSLRKYSPQHRFYPEDTRLLSHEISGMEPDCWILEDVLASDSIDTDNETGGNIADDDDTEQELNGNMTGSEAVDI